MKLPATVFLIIFSASIYQFLERINAENNMLCTPCEGPECDITFGSCYFGIYRNFCGQMDCKRGPNQTCGGLFDHRGKCGDGLSCRCNVCVGCSTDTLECYYRHCRPERPEEPIPPNPARGPFATPRGSPIY